MQITIEPTGEFTSVEGTRCRMWRGKTDKGTPVDCFIALVRSPAAAAQPEIDAALQEVEVVRELVSYDHRMVV